MSRGSGWLAGVAGFVLALLLSFSLHTDAQVAPGGAGTGYPPGAIPITASATGTTGAFSATLPGVPGRTTYLCGFVISSGGTSTAIVTNTTVSGTVSGALNFTYVDVSSGQGLMGFATPLCIPASAQNTAIIANAPAGGAGTVAAVTAWGYQL